MRETQGLAKATVGKNEWLLRKLAPYLGRVPVADVSAPMLLTVLQEIQGSGNRETARRLRSYISRVQDYAIITGRAQHNPAAPLQRALITPTVRHHPAIVDPHELGSLLRQIDNYSGYPSTLAALRISAHLFQRPGEIRAMRWADLDLEAARWSMPAGSTKMRRAHEVPLSRQARETIRSMAGITRGEFVFPAYHAWTQPISENAVNQALARMGYKGVMTAHGFRSTASSLLNESGQWSPDIIEQALAHKDNNAIRAIYNRTTYWNDRVAMMQWWSDYLDGLKAEAGHSGNQKRSHEQASARPQNRPQKGPGFS